MIAVITGGRCLNSFALVEMADKSFATSLVLCIAIKSWEQQHLDQQ